MNALNSVMDKLVTHSARLIGLTPEEDEAYLTKSLFMGNVFRSTMFMTLLSAVYFLFGEPTTGAFLVTCIILIFVNIVAFNRSQNFEFFRRWQLLLILFVPFLLTLLLGGVVNSSAVILWSVLAPLGMVISTDGLRRSPPWFMGFAVLLGVAIFLQPYLRPANHLPPLVISILLATNIWSLMGIIFSTLHYFVQQKDVAYGLLRVEREKSETLLLNILPKEIASILKNDNRIIAQHFEDVSILFADVVNFTPLSTELTPEEMVNLLNDIFSHFDTLAEKHGLEKIKTIGDCYMVAAGVPSPRLDHAEAIAKMALEMSVYIEQHSYPGTKQKLDFRTGINSGPVVAGVIGRKKFIYDLWGDTVNTASRMESHSLPGKIQITQQTYDLLKDKFICEARGKVTVKGKGEMETWYLTGMREATP